MMTKKLLLVFPKCETEKPIVYHLVKDYGLVVNIFRAKVTPEEQGYLVLDVTGESEAIDKGMDYIRTFNVIINETNKGVRWDAAGCTHCGNCVPHCPTRALHVKDPSSREIAFNEVLCIECMSCIGNCPYRACSSVF